MSGPKSPSLERTHCLLFRRKGPGTTCIAMANTLSPVQVALPSSTKLRPLGPACRPRKLFKPILSQPVEGRPKFPATDSTSSTSVSTGCTYGTTGVMLSAGGSPTPFSVPPVSAMSPPVSVNPPCSGPGAWPQPVVAFGSESTSSPAGLFFSRPGDPALSPEMHLPRRSRYGLGHFLGQLFPPAFLPYWTINSCAPLGMVKRTRR